MRNNATLAFIVTLWLAPVTVAQNRTTATVDQVPWGNTVLTGSVSGGAQNWLTFSGLTLTINGGTTPLVMYIGGLLQVANSNLSITVPSTASTTFYILAKQDTANVNMVAGDFLTTSIAPVYSPTSPTCPSSGVSSTNPFYWFNMATNQAQLCTANSGVFSASPSIIIGTVTTNATPTIASVAYNPFQYTVDPPFPHVFIIPAANCSNTTAGTGWSIGSGGTVTCRAGTNNLGGYISITDTAASFATFQIAVPEDWNSNQFPYIRFQLASTDAVNAHTIIPEINVACYKGDGSTTDDVAANGFHTLTTVTLNGVANRFWSTSTIQMNATDLTGCVPGALMQITVGRATDTATNAEFYSATVTFPRLPIFQAN